jgi:hypothetical protein
VRLRGVTKLTKSSGVRPVPCCIVFTDYNSFPNYTSKRVRTRTIRYVAALKRSGAIDGKINSLELDRR